MRSALRGLATVVAVLALIATAGVALAGIGGAPALPSGDRSASSAGIESSEPTETDASPEPGIVPAEGCSTVTITPPTSPDRWLGDLCVPPGGHRDLAVVLVHGGGGYGGSRGDMASWAQVYQYAGYVTFSVDYLIFGNTTRSPVYPEPEQDVKAAVQYLRERADELAIDVDRIVVHGSSAGSRLGGQLYVSGNDPYYYGAEMWPVTPDHINGFIGFYGYYSGMSADEERYYGGVRSSADPEVRERWDKADSVINAENATGPSLLIHGEEDGVIEVAQTEQFAAALEDAGADVTTKIVPGANHGFDVVDGGALTDAGREMARTVLDWLDWQFPVGEPHR